MATEVMLYETLGISEERVKEIEDKVESIMFFTSYDITEVPSKIVEEIKDPKELFVAAALFIRIHDYVNNKVYKG